MLRGKRESHWLVLRRCLAIIRRAQRGPASCKDLITAVLAQEGPEAYGPVEGKALYHRLRHDLERIRNHLNIDLYYDRQKQSYILRNLWLPLLDLPDKDLETIAWLEQTFGHDSPQHDEVHELLGQLRFYLAPERAAVIERCHTVLAVDLEQRDEDEISASVWEGLGKALVERRRIEFQYRSPAQEDLIPRRHIVDPYERYFDTARGHYYLRGWCHYTDGPLGRYEQKRYFHYRLGRIESLKILPDKIPPFPPSAPRYVVEYELAPAIARLGVTHHPWIEITKIEKLENEGIRLSGTTDNLFQAVRSLLHYGPNCRVIGGTEVLQEMIKVVEALTAIYADRSAHKCGDKDVVR